ncbi:MAG TPA: cyclic nucleotide-binding domain-containing protein [Pyrinomonadaceae bacterium]|jgi:hypothetical protein
MADDLFKKYEPKFPQGEHEDCRALTELTVEQLPPDGSLGRTRRYRAKTYVWQPDDRSDRIYFLLRGRVCISAGSADGGEVVIRTVEPGQPFGELCFCGGPTAYRRTTATAESETVEIKLVDFMNYARALTVTCSPPSCSRSAPGSERSSVASKCSRIATPRSGWRGCCPTWPSSPGGDTPNSQRWTTIRSFCL